MLEIIRKYKDKSRLFIKEKFTEDGAGWLFLQQLIIAPMSLITTVLLARLLSISNYGYYKYILSVYAIIALFSIDGIRTITIMNIQRGDNFFFLAFKYRKFLRWIPSTISLLISIYYFSNHNYFLGILFSITIFSHFIVDTYDFYLIGLQGKGKFKLNAILAIGYYIFSFFPPILTAYFTDNLYLVFITMYICQGVFRIFGFFYIKKKLYSDSRSENIFIEENKIKKWKQESISLSVNSALVNAGGSLSSIIVFNRLGSENNAIYSLALAIVDFVSGVIISTFSKSILVLSRMSRDGFNDSDKKNYIRSLFKKYFWLALMATICSIILLPWIYKFLFAKYFFSYKYAIVYSFSLLALTFAPALYFFTEKRRFKIINTIQTLILLLNISSIFFASMYFGVLGAIVVTISIKFISNIIYTLMIYSHKTD